MLLNAYKLHKQHEFQQTVLSSNINREQQHQQQRLTFGFYLTGLFS